MIAQVRGRLVRKEPQEAVVDVGGVGYRVAIPLSTFYRIGEAGDEVTLLTHTHVREDTLALFGFLTHGEQALFGRLIAISGVGPKLALSILSGIEAPDLVAAGEPVPAGPAAATKEDLVSALVHLGYSRPEAERGVDRALKEGGEGRFEDLLRRTLRALSGR